MKYPNNNCGECPGWLAFDPPEVSYEMLLSYCKSRHCNLLEEENEKIECDGRCLNCDYFHEVRGCIIKEE